MAEIIAPYSQALFFNAAALLIVMLQGFVAAFFRNAVGKHVAGAAVPADHGSATFRMVRSFENSLENTPLFAVVVLIAITIQVSPAWVWWTSLIVLAGRAAHWAFYALNVPLLRTVSFAAGAFAALALGVVTTLTAMG